MCKLLPCTALQREFYANILIIDTHGFDVILKINWLGTFYEMVDSRRKSIVFKIPDNLKLKFVGGKSQVEQTKFKSYPMEGVLAHLEAILVDILVISEFMDITVK